jgi:hypothetical protein
MAYNPQKDVKDVKNNIAAAINASALSVDGSSPISDTINNTAEIAMRIKRSVFPMFFFINQMYESNWFKKQRRLLV